MPTPIDRRKRAAMDALLNAGWAEDEVNASAMADVVLSAVDKVGWDAHVDSALAVLDQPTDADVVTLYEEEDHRWVGIDEDTQERDFPFPDNKGGKYFTITGELNRMVDSQVTEETVRRICEETGEESANYIVERYLITDEHWKFVRFDSESGQFFAYTRTHEEAVELRDYIEGLTWTLPKED
jgi:hypothetical protein